MPRRSAILSMPVRRRGYELVIRYVLETLIDEREEFYQFFLHYFLNILIAKDRFKNVWIFT